MGKFFRMSVMVGCCSMIVACGTLTRMEPDDDQVRDPVQRGRYARTGDLKAEVDVLVEPLIAKGEAPGMVVGVLRPDGTMQFFGYGVTGRSERATPEADTLFPIGSLSKGFLGAMVALLVDEGKLAWDDTLEKLLPAGNPLSDAAKKITVLQLATHTSGLPRQPFDLQTLNYFAQFVWTGENFYRHFTYEYLMDYLAEFKAPSHITPQYSNIGYAILGELVERRTGQSLETLLAQEITQPLGLIHTGYHPEQLSGYQQRAQGHAGDQPKFMRRGQPVADWDFSNSMKGAAGVYSSARDLLVFAAAHINRAPLQGKTPEYATHFHQVLADNLRVRVPQPEDAPGIAWVTDEMSGLEITNQVGVVVGHTTYVGIDRQHRTAVVVLQNSFNWNYKVGHKLLIRMARAGES